MLNRVGHTSFFAELLRTFSIIMNLKYVQEGDARYQTFKTVQPGFERGRQSLICCFIGTR